MPNAEQVMVQAAKDAGFKSAALVTAVSVSLAEDPTSDPKATNKNTNGTTDYGLWQINSIHAEFSPSQLLTPTYNAMAAYKLSKGGLDWTPWVTYNAPPNKNGKANPASSAYYLQKAELLVLGKYLDTGEADPQGATGGAFTALGGAAYNTAKGFTSWTDGLTALLNKLTSGSFWLRIGEGAAAVAILVFGLVLLFRKPIGSAVKTAAEVAP